MTQKTFANLLKTAILLAFLCTAAVYVLYLPAVADETRTVAASLSSLYLPCLIFAELTVVPILCAMVLAWRIASEIGRDNSFCRENARRMKIIAWLALADAAYFWAGILVFWFAFGAASGPLLILSVLIGMVGVIIALCAGALSHLILKAAILREENDLTV